MEFLGNVNEKSTYFGLMALRNDAFNTTAMANNCNKNSYLKQ